MIRGADGRAWAEGFYSLYGMILSPNPPYSMPEYKLVALSVCR
nr:MAG TPA: hypothetical protein [Caudoviricetes sp.]